MSLKRSENKKAVNRAVDLCDSQYQKKGLWYQQDCIQGVNILRRVVRRGVSVHNAERAARLVCINLNDSPGPRGRCQMGVRMLAANLKRK